MTADPSLDAGGTPPLAGDPGHRPGATSDPLLRVGGLRVVYQAGDRQLTAVDGVSFDLARSASIAIMGESGSGKTSLGLALLGLGQGRSTSITGSVRLDGVELLGKRREDLEDVRGSRIAMIFQDPLSSLNPVKRVGDQVAEMFTRHRGLSGRQAKEAAIAAMARAHIPDARRRASDYPHQFSGGLRQRVMIATAIALSPQLLIADEPTTALDVTVQAQIVALLSEIRAEYGMALVLISHDLGLAAALSDDVLVMYAGRTAETGRLRDVFEHPAHPYTRGLLASAPRATPQGQRLAVITGAPPRLDDLPSGCAFRPRCPLAFELCAQVIPLPGIVGVDHAASCHVTAPVPAPGPLHD